MSHARGITPDRASRTQAVSARPQPRNIAPIPCSLFTSSTRWHTLFMSASATVCALRRDPANCKEASLQLQGESAACARTPPRALGCSQVLVYVSSGGSWTHGANAELQHTRPLCGLQLAVAACEWSAQATTTGSKASLRVAGCVYGLRGVAQDRRGVKGRHYGLQIAVAVAGCGGPAQGR